MGIKLLVLDDGERIVDQTFETEADAVAEMYSTVGNHARRKGSCLEPETDDLEQVAEAARDLDFDVYVDHVTPERTYVPVDQTAGDGGMVIDLETGTVLGVHMLRFVAMPGTDPDDEQAIIGYAQRHGRRLYTTSKE